MKGIRTSRESDARRAEERMVQLREMPDFLNQSNLLDIPKEWIPEGWVYKWGRAATLGEPDNTQLNQLASQGWTSVPVERHPQLMLAGISFRNEYLNGYIHRGGLILFERPVEWDRMQMEKMHEYANSLVNRMPGCDGFQSQSGIITSQLMDPQGHASSVRRTIAYERNAW